MLIIQRTSNEPFFERVPALARALYPPLSELHKPRLDTAHPHALASPHAGGPHRQRRCRTGELLPSATT